jgi:hypothetical protein
MSNLEESLTYQHVKAECCSAACDPEMWNETDGQSVGKFVVEIIMSVFGRVEAEKIALMWNQAGRDDIAAKIKDIIHKETKTP